ncbi:protein of unknown function (plasmid) [Pararobbsia alpina]
MGQSVGRHPRVAVGVFTTRSAYDSVTHFYLIGVSDHSLAISICGYSVTARQVETNKMTQHDAYV